MKASEYKTLLTRAIRDSKGKWGIQAKDTGVNIEECPICSLTAKITNSCIYCPLHAPKPSFNCCEGFDKWLSSATTAGEKKAARHIIKELGAIDVDAWTQHLVDEGVLNKLFGYKGGKNE